MSDKPKQRYSRKKLACALQEYQCHERQRKTQHLFHTQGDSRDMLKAMHYQRFPFAIKKITEQLVESE